MSWRGTLPTACWDATEATTIIPVEAEATSDGVFLATHSSIPITQRDQIQNAFGGTVVDEHALLRAVQDQPADQPIIPILGKSGTGKSHLVRWLRVHLDTKDSTRMIFVPKHKMSLRGILELILKHATGPRADELRAKVATAVDAAADETAAQLRLRAELAVLVETRGETKDGTPEEIELRAYLASRNGLPALFGDDVFRSRLLAEDGPIARLVREKLTGKGAEEKDDAFGFTSEDLNLSVDDVSRAGAAAKIVAGSLTSDPSLRDLAAAMLNEQLGPAVSEVFGIGGDDLKQILVDVRVELEQQGLELLVLIEDFSIFQGIQGGLIDAITLISSEDLKLCPMRVVMAVTTGYFVNQMPDTVYTRPYKVFDLDPMDGATTVFESAGFTARYLNAVRVGATALDLSHEDKEPLTNACEQCPVRPSCHTAFGQVDGFGLFPFNRPALSKAIASQSTDGAFVARDVLTRAVRPVLHRDQTELNGNRFPSEGFAEDFKTGALGELDNIEDLHRLRTPGDPEMSARRERLVRFWGTGNGPENLDPTIHAAFGVPPIDGLEHAPVKEEEAPSNDKNRDSESRESAPPPPPPPADPPLVKAVDRWRATGDLEQSDRNNLRNLVHQAVTARLVLDDGYGGDGPWTNGRKEFAPTFDASSSIALDKERLDGALVPIDRDNVDDVRVLRALAWVSKTEIWADVPGGEPLHRLCEAKLDAWAKLVVHGLLPHRGDGDDLELIRLAHTLLAISKSLGIPEAFKSDAQSRVKALFAPAPGQADPLARPILGKWQKQVSEAGVGREGLQQRMLRRASYTQGAGKALAVDVPRLLRAVRDMNGDTAWPEPTSDLLVSTADAVATWSANLVQVRDEASQRVPDVSDLGGELADVAGELSILIGERANAGGLPGSIDPDGLRRAARSIKAGDQKVVESVRDALDRWDELAPDDRLRLLTSDWEQPNSRISAWLVPAIAAVATLEANLQAGPASDAQLEYDGARQDLIDSLEALSSTVTEISGPEVVG